MSDIVAESAVPAPQIVRDEFSGRFWDEIQQRRLLLQWCASCRSTVYYPRALCPQCHRGDLEWRESAGRGEVYSVTVVRRPTRPYGTDTPFPVALVDLDDGARMMARLEEVEPADVRIGMRVQVGFTDLGGFVVPHFVPAASTPREIR